jgi:plastocyanin
MRHLFATPGPATSATPGTVLPILLLIAVLAGGGVLASAVPARAGDPIEIRIRDNRFHPEVVKVPAGQKVRLKVVNEGTEAEEFESYELNREKVIRPGKTVTIFLPPLEKGEYPFFGEFHPETARGRIVAE